MLWAYFVEHNIHLRLIGLFGFNRNCLVFPLTCPSITFHHPMCGEFWIGLTLRATEPEVVKVPLIECELGKSKVVSVLLNNPTDETYRLKPQLINCDVYTLHMGISVEELDKPSAQRLGGSPVRKNVCSSRSLLRSRQSHVDQLPDLHQAQGGSAGQWIRTRTTPCTVLTLGAHTTLRLGLNFTPCNLGTKEHEGVVQFFSEKLGVWRFVVCGRGLPPQPRETVCTYVPIGSATTLIIPITNPLKHPVIMDIYLTAASVSGLLKRLEETRRVIVDNSQGSLDPLLTNAHRINRSPSNLTLIKPEDEPFQLLLKRERSVPLQHFRNIRLDGKTSFDIPLSFAPVEMRETEAICCVVMRRADGQLPEPGNKDTIEEDEPLEIRWLIPIKVSFTAERQYWLVDVTQVENWKQKSNFHVSTVDVY
ncbi:hypothetical protein PHET_10713 [Paragonimus heterotremus]|uniref:Uncharacterized protein n=1 Tax=Paragonimus heterotremus TaxID=100268 RepID=A0A8J4SIS8_9TREM|nr:hypothetical protein PHET_10713 [Paragonimus heterotremus]